MYCECSGHLLVCNKPHKNLLVYKTTNIYYVHNSVSQKLGQGIGEMVHLASHVWGLSLGGSKDEGWGLPWWRSG